MEKYPLSLTNQLIQRRKTLMKSSTTIRGRIILQKDFPLFIYLENGEVQKAVLSNQKRGESHSMKEKIQEGREKWDGRCIMGTVLSAAESGSKILTNVVSILPEQADIPTSIPHKNKEIEYNSFTSISFDTDSNFTLVGTKDGKKHTIAQRNVNLPLTWFVSSLFNSQSYLYLGHFPCVKVVKDFVSPAIAAATVVEKELMGGEVVTDWEGLITSTLERNVEENTKAPQAGKLPPPRSTSPQLPPSAPVKSSLPPGRPKQNSVDKHMPEFTSKKQFTGSNKEWKEYKAQFPLYDFDRKQLKELV